MIEYEIRNPSIFQRYGRHLGVVQQQQNSTRHDFYPDRHSDPRYWGKFAYTSWVEEIKKEYKVNDLVCLKGIPITSSGPLMYGMVEAINELCWDTPVDQVHNEPMALFVRTVRGAQMRFAPSALRHLTEEEIASALSRDNPTFNQETPDRAG